MKNEGLTPLQLAITHRLPTARNFTLTVYRRRCFNVGCCELPSFLTIICVAGYNGQSRKVFF